MNEAYRPEVCNRITFLFFGDEHYVGQIEDVKEIMTLVLPRLYARQQWVVGLLEGGRRCLVTVSDTPVLGEAPPLRLTVGDVRVMVVGRHLGEVMYLPDVDHDLVLDSTLPPLRWVSRTCIEEEEKSKAHVVKISHMTFETFLG